MKWYSLGYLAGLTSLNFIRSAEMADWQLVLCLSFIMLFWLAISRSLLKLRYLKITKIILSLVIGLLLASLSAKIWLNNSRDIIGKPQVYRVTGSVCSIPQKLKESSFRENKETVTLKFDFCLSDIDGNRLNILQNDKLKLNYYRTEETQSQKLTAGSRWLFEVKLKPNHGRLNPVGFDYEKWLLSEGYLATGYIKSASALKTGFGVREFYHKVRQSIYSAVSLATTNDNTRGVILALAMGERSKIDPTQWQYIVDSGTAHLLAISGLHIGIAALWGFYSFLFVFRNVTWITRRYSAQRLAEVASLMSALLVTLISGLGFPSQRALIMLSLFFACRWAGRKLSVANLLGLSVIVITIFQPFAVMSMSFWLSVYAVAIIALIVSYKQQTNEHLTKVKAWLRLNWLLFLGLIPISWWFFDQFAVVGFLANVLLIPLTTFISAPLIYIGLVCLIFSEQLASGVFYLAEHSISLTLLIQEKLAKLNQVASIPSLSEVGALSLIIVVFLFLIPKSMPGRSIALPSLVLLLATLINSKQQSNFQLVMFDVGHGLAMSISNGEKHLVYDTGFARVVIDNRLGGSHSSKADNPTKFKSQYSVARSSLVPYLKKRGVSHIDQLIISHNDLDHSGGLIEMIDNFSVGELLLGENNIKQWEPNFNDATISSINNCHTKTAWSWEQVSFKFITTPNHFATENRTVENSEVSNNSKVLKYSGNNASCILLIETKQNKILIAGDIEKKVEKELVLTDQKHSLSDIDILVAPHHGSETSSIAEFVDHLTPKLVLFSAAYANQWKFPREAVVQRYEKVGATLLTSYRTGAVIITITDSGELSVLKERQNKPRFWHHILP